VLVVGSVGLDTVETPTASADEVLGGSAIYFAAAASLFAPVRLVGVVGGDFPPAARERFAARGVDLAGLETVPDGKTFRWHGRYTNDMNDRETVSVELNVLGSFQPTLPETFRSSPFVFLANGPTATQHSVRDQLVRTPFVAADTMNLWIETERAELERLLTRIDCLVLNDAEARMITGIPSLWHAARAILSMGPKTVALKKAEHGSYLVGAAGECAVPAYPIERLVDPTGAGDAYAGAFMGYLAREGAANAPALRAGLAAASAVASFACESLGPDRLLGVTAEEVDERMRRLRGLVSF
jgi:sugar/nucleoside kinase (ribokinase family)